MKMKQQQKKFEEGKNSQEEFSKCKQSFNDFILSFFLIFFGYFIGIYSPIVWNAFGRSLKKKIEYSNLSFVIWSDTLIRTNEQR